MIFIYFQPYLGKIPNLTSIFQRGWNHQLEICFKQTHQTPCFLGWIFKVLDCWEWWFYFAQIVFVKWSTWSWCLRRRGCGCSWWISGRSWTLSFAFKSSDHWEVCGNILEFWPWVAKSCRGLLAWYFSQRKNSSRAMKKWAPGCLG